MTQSSLGDLVVLEPVILDVAIVSTLDGAVGGVGCADIDTLRQ